MNSKNNTKDLLADSLKELMVKKSFEKITIKQICDATGVIRIVFYNYFSDKYDALEYIVDRDLYETVLPYIKCKKREDAFKVMIYTIQENIDFYRAGYQIIGQNSFEDAVYKAVGKIVSDFSKHIDTNLISYDKFYKGTLLKFHTIMIAEGIKEYVLNDKEFDPLYLIELYRWLISSSEILLEEK